MFVTRRYKGSIHICFAIQHYVIKLVSDLQQVGGFLRVLRFPQEKNKRRYNTHRIHFAYGVCGLWCLTPHLSIFQLYRGYQFIGA
jgi:hypothetical protein